MFRTLEVPDFSNMVKGNDSEFRLAQNGERFLSPKEKGGTLHN
jgi:hypothetical protein